MANEPHTPGDPSNSFRQLEKLAREVQSPESVMGAAWPQITAALPEFTTPDALRLLLLNIADVYNHELLALTLARKESSE